MGGDHRATLFLAKLGTAEEELETPPPGSGCAGGEEGGNNERGSEQGRMKHRLCSTNNP